MQSHLGGLIQFAANDTLQASFTGHIYRKQLAKYGEWVNPEYPYLSSDPIMTLDETWGNKIVENFNNNTLGSPVPVPLNHTNDVSANTGSVLSLESIPGDGLYGNLEIRDKKTIEDLDNKVIFDVSISFDWNHRRTDNGKSYGPTLLHVALVNNPYLIEMNSFEKIGPALSRLEEQFKTVGLENVRSTAIMLSRDKMKEFSSMESTTQDAIELDAEPVEGETSEEETVTEEETEETVEETAEETGSTEHVEGDTTEDTSSELSRLRLENEELKLSRAYDALLAEGKVTPAQKDKIMALASLSQGVQLSADNKTDLASVVLDILGTGVQRFSTEESGSSKEEEATSGQDQSVEGHKPSELLTENELEGLKALGVSPEKMDELAEKDPVYAEALASLSKK